MNLPGISGLEVLAKLRADSRTLLLPVVVFTSSVEERDQLASYYFGANSFVLKPPNTGEFEETVSRLALYWAGTNAPLLGGSVSTQTH